MEEVEVSRTVDASHEAVKEVLSPRSIMEYAGTYEVYSVEPTDEGWVLEGGTTDLEVTFEFTEVENGYVYQQRDGEGPFAEMYASVTVAGDDPVTVTVRSCFTFGMPFAWLTDRIAARDRRLELERLLADLASDVEPPDA